MKVLVDLHHDGLYESLRLLLEERLGWQMYRPIGLEWHTEGYWAVYDHPATAQQYLALTVGQEFAAMQEQQPGCHPWMNLDAMQQEPGVYFVPDRLAHVIHRAVTLEAFRRMPFDLYVSSMPQHFPRFERLRQETHPTAKHIFQCGNMWQIPAGVKNLLNSTTVVPPPGVHHVHYHQEFDLTKYGPHACPNPRSVINLMHYQQPKYTREFEQLEEVLAPRGWTFMNCGAGNRNGPVADVTQALREHGFLWHNKAGGEGYGYNLHNAAAMGRPIICHHSLFKGMQAEHLLFDGHLSVDLDHRSWTVVADLLTGLVASHQTWVERVREHFERHVNFDEEFVRIQAFMEDLK